MRFALYRPLLAALLLSMAGGESGANNRPWIRKDIPFGEKLKLNAYGGSDIELQVLNRELSTIHIQWADNTQKVPKTSTDVNGYSQVIYVSPVFTRNVKKENGISPDGRLSEAYLIYDDQPSGVKVYFYDTIGTRQNECALFIEQPRPGAASKNVGPERAKESNPTENIAALG